MYSESSLHKHSPQYIFIWKKTLLSRLILIFFSILSPYILDTEGGCILTKNIFLSGIYGRKRRNWNHIPVLPFSSTSHTYFSLVSSLISEHYTPTRAITLLTPIIRKYLHYANISTSVLTAVKSDCPYSVLSPPISCTSPSPISAPVTTR